MESIHPLKAYRKSCQPPLSQKRFADLVGVARETVARWETGRLRIGEDVLPLVAEKTGIARAKLRPDLVALLGEAAE